MEPGALRGAVLAQDGEFWTSGENRPAAQLVREELKQDRNVIVYLQHTGNPRLAERLVRLLAPVAPAMYLDVNKVPATRRDGWITSA